MCSRQISDKYYVVSKYQNKNKNIKTLVWERVSMVDGPLRSHNLYRPARPLHMTCLIITASQCCWQRELNVSHNLRFIVHSCIRFTAIRNVKEFALVDGTRQSCAFSTSLLVQKRLPLAECIQDNGMFWLQSPASENTRHCRAHFCEF